MKFKVGDKVRVVKCFGGNTEDEKCLGKIFTIKSIMSGYGYPYIFEEYSGCAWCDDELEFAPFTKADLKDGMVVEYRDGRRRMVLGDNLIGEHGHAPLRDYNENLEEENYPEETIEKVYKSKATLINCLFYDTILEIIWERPKEELAKKMTVAEIEKELGYKVEIVSEN
jgi:hypothetical protein